MFNNNLYIDGVDVHAEYGAFIVGKNAYKDIVGFPTMKSVKSNNWAEEDGIEPDLSANAYRVSDRALTLQFGFHGNKKNIDAFLTMLSGKVYHTFDFADLRAANALRLDLRLVSSSKIDDKADNRLGLLTLKFNADTYAYLTPSEDIDTTGKQYVATAADEYHINGVPFSTFNMAVLKGALDSIRKPADVKPNLSTKQAYANGLYYDRDGDVRYKSKDVRVPCLMRASTMAAFWRQHKALFAELTKSDGQTLTVGVTGVEYPCYYKSCNVTRFYTDIGDVIWFEFALTFTITANLRKI